MKEPTLTRRPNIKKGTKDVFNNPFLEKLTRSNIFVPISIFLLISLTLLFLGITQKQIGLIATFFIFISGLLLFTLVEYLVHKYLFHMITNTKIKEKIQYNFHGIHHEFPKDKDRLAMPPVVSILIAGLLFLSFRFVIGDYVYAFLPGVMFGYASYLFVHYAVHAYPPPKNFLRILWINHGIHHYKNDDVAFGVSSPLWDYIFRTTPK
ncbi:MAG: sterol desaturase family protein [Bacteroidota bacterium]|nr:sterol desaturase family protein [Bacteroidota bacterium]